MVRPSARGVAAAGAAAILALGACSGSGGPAPHPVRIGSLLPVETLGIPHFLAGLRAAARDIDAHGGIHGRPVEIDNCDDQQDPNRANACAHALVRDQVVATAGSVTSLSMVEAPILDAAGIPQVGGEALNPEDTSLPTAFPLDGGALTQLAGLVFGIRQRGLRTIFLFTVDVPAGRLAAQLTAQIAAAAGATVVGEALAPSAAIEYTPYAMAAIQSRAQVVLPAVLPIQLLRFLSASRQASARFPVAFPYGDLAPRDIQRLGGRRGPTEHSIEFSSLPPVTATDRFPALRRFQADMDAEQRSGDGAAGPQWRTGAVLTAWLSVQIVAGIASTLPAIDAHHLLRALQASPTVDTLGLTPPWTPGRIGPAGYPRLTNGFGYFITQRNGVEVLADPDPFDVLPPLGLGR